MGIGVTSVILSVPLILKMVPMNRFYGVRTRKTFVSDHNWYEINAFGGKIFLIFGAFLVIFGYISKSFAPEPTSPWAPVFLSMPFLLLLPLLFAIHWFSRRFPDE